MLNRKNMYVLIDYDNLPSKLKLFDVNRICEEIVYTCQSSIFKDTKLIFRMYGGWMNGKNKTDMSVEIEGAIRQRNFIIMHNGVRIPAKCDLAFGLIGGHPIPSTFRTHRRVRRIEIDKPSCSKCNPCSVVRLYPIVNSNMRLCSEGYFSDFFYQNEQKLVDSMIIADLIEISHNNIKFDDYIFVVSSDDDMIPGVLVALKYSKVILIDLNRDSFRYGNLLKKYTNFERIGYRI